MKKIMLIFAAFVGIVGGNACGMGKKTITVIPIKPVIKNSLMYTTYDGQGNSYTPYEFQQEFARDRITTVNSTNKTLFKNNTLESAKCYKCLSGEKNIHWTSKLGILPALMITPKKFGTLFIPVGAKFKNAAHPYTEITMDNRSQIDGVLIYDFGRQIEEKFTPFFFEQGPEKTRIAPLKNWLIAVAELAVVGYGAYYLGKKIFGK